MFSSAYEALRNDDHVVIFPEGTRKPVGRPGPIKRGLGILVESVGAPWLPCLLRGTVSAKDALKDTDCQVIQALDMDGVINATTSIHFPLTVVMERHDEPGAAGRAT